MARKLTSADQQPQGPNSESFTAYYREFRTLSHAARSANGKLREFWKRVKSDGFKIAEMKATIAEQDIDPDEIRASDETRATYRRWLGLPVGTQADLHFDGGAKQLMANGADAGPPETDPPEAPLDGAVAAAAAAKTRKSRARQSAELTAP